MKKLKNKFILGIICGIIVIVLFQAYKAYSNNQRDTRSYVTNIEGRVQLNDIPLEKNKATFLQVGDSVSVGAKSIGLIEWGDGSLTRLGENTKISVQENTISRDYTKINISFDLIAGKTWSNVVSFLGKDSSFTQSFQGMEAGIRGTVFDVDLTADFLNVSSHQVVLTDTQGKTQIIQEGQPIQLSTLNFIQWQDFIENIQDQAWKNLNETYDAAYFEQLKKSLEDSLSQSSGVLFVLDWISPSYRILYELDHSSEYDIIDALILDVAAEERENVYQAIFSRYQDLNFIEAKDVEFYKKKVFYKRALLSLSSDAAEKEQLLRTSTYDLQDILSTKTQLGLTETLDILLEHKDILSEIDTQFLTASFDLIPEDILQKFQKDIGDMRALFSKNIDIQNIKTKTEEEIQDFAQKFIPLFEH